MEEKKKRVRPTVAQVKKLEKELSDIKENYRLSLLTNEHQMEEITSLRNALIECKTDYARVEEMAADIAIGRQALLNFSLMLRDGKKDPALLKQASEAFQPLISMVYGDIVNALPRKKVIEKMRSELETLKQSNSLMEQELDRQRKETDKYVALMKASDQRCEQLEKRGLWARIMNKK